MKVASFLSGSGTGGAAGRGNSNCGQAAVGQPGVVCSLEQQATTVPAPQDIAQGMDVDAPKQVTPDTAVFSKERDHAMAWHLRLQAEGQMMSCT